MTELVLEGPLLRLPYELLRVNFKNQQKITERDSAWLESISRNSEQNEENGSLSDELDSMLQRLTSSRKKLAKLAGEETERLTVFRARIDHMSHLLGGTSDLLSDIHHARLQRLIVEFMLRQGLLETGKQLASDLQMENLLDVDVFTQCRNIRQCLLRSSTKECASWCNDNRSALKKANKFLEFELRRQEFIELVRSKQIAEAISYSQKNLAQYRFHKHKEVDEVCALLCYPESTLQEPYKSLYSAERWKILADLFLVTHHELLSIPAMSPLEVGLSVGLSALTTPTCCTSHETATNVALCPVCSPELEALAKCIVPAHAARTHLVDILSGEVMEGENEPIVLPNGRVYGSKALSAWNEKHVNDKNTLQDPQTGEVFAKSAVRKAFVL